MRHRPWSIAHSESSPEVKIWVLSEVRDPWSMCLLRQLATEKLSCDCDVVLGSIAKYQRAPKDCRCPSCWRLESHCGGLLPCLVALVSIPIDNKSSVGMHFRLFPDAWGDLLSATSCLSNNQIPYAAKTADCARSWKTPHFPDDRRISPQRRPKCGAKSQSLETARSAR